MGLYVIKVSYIEEMAGGEEIWTPWNNMKISYLKIREAADVADFLQRYFHHCDKHSK